MDTHDESTSTQDTARSGDLPVALVTGGSRGLGRELVAVLLERGWTVVTDGRDDRTLRTLVDSFDSAAHLVALPGDVTDPVHRDRLVDAVRQLGRLDVLVNNASTLGVTPLPFLSEQRADDLAAAIDVNLLAPHSLTTALADVLRASGGAVVNITSDAAVEAYPGWGAYAASKAALEQWSNVFSTEEPDVDVYWVDPGDLRTDLHQAAFPGEDISDRPLPEVAVPGLLALIEDRPPSGRFRAMEVSAS